VNGSALHSLPVTLNLWNNWIANDIVEEVNIRVSNYPLPVTTRQELVNDQFSAFNQALFFLIGFAFIPGASMFFIVNEKANKSKHQQLVSGISLASYWVSNFLADIIIGLPASILVFISLFVFDADAFTGEAAGPVILCLIMFLFASMPFTYLVSFLFSSPSKAQLTCIVMYIMTGYMLALVWFILGLFESTQDINEDLEPIYRIFPIFLLAESLVNISLKELFNPDAAFMDWDFLGRNYFLMCIEGVGYFALVLFLEYLSTFPVLLAKLGFVTDRPMTEVDDELDSDVLDEKQRILNGLYRDPETNELRVDEKKLDDTVVISGLRKVYKPAGGRSCSCKGVADEDKVEAVTNLHFGVKQSEVFGYLGVNGAGKTTTLATLTGERYPSAGDAFIAKHHISNQLAARRYVGYCPQFDAIFDLLTAAEHLKFYAMIKGLRGEEADEQVKVLLSALTLNKYKDRNAGTYSGGNKRKLSVAVAMIGNPPVIFLDEPSTGMDPVSRRHMWEFISTTMAGRCVILTTHSMEECEALCNRVGIMVNGQLRCIGTAQHLKSRYGKGYQLDLTLTQQTVNGDESEKAETLEKLQNALAKSFGTISLIENNGSRVSYELVKSEAQLKLGAMFNILEEMKNGHFEAVIEAYALSQTTLEQIFIRMAKQGEDEKSQQKKEKTLIMDPTL